MTDEMAPRPEPAQTRMVQEFKHNSPLLGCRIDPTGKFVFAGAQDNSIQRWELATGKKTALAGHKGWLRAFAFADKVMLSGDYHGKLLWWTPDAETPEPLRIVDAHDGWLRALAVSPDGKTVASCGNDKLVKLWNIADGKLVAELKSHACHVYNVAFHPKGELVSADLKGFVKVWDVAAGKVLRELDAAVLWKYDNSFKADHGGIRSMAFNAEATHLACAGITNVSNAFAGVGNPAAVLFDWESGKRAHLLTAKEAFQGTLWGIGWHPAGYWIGAGGGSGGALWFWKGDQGPSFQAIKLPNNARDLSLHPDGLRLAVAHADGALRMYEMLAKPPAAK